MPHLELTVASGAALSVRRIEAHEAISSLFTVSVWARVRDPALDLSAIVGQPAKIRADAADGTGLFGERTWSGVVSFAEQVRVEQKGLSTYFFRIVPTLWLLTQRKNHRIYQHLSIPQIIERLLKEWGIEHAFSIDAALYPPLEFKVQWGEPDFAFFSRLLEEAGISFTFPEGDGGSSLLLIDAPQKAEARAGGPLRWVEEPPRSTATEHVTNVGIGHEVRPGAFTFRDHDHRRPAFALFGEATRAAAPEDRYEQYHYRPGAFAADVDLGEVGSTPHADDRGAVRHVDAYGDARAERALAGERAGRRAVSFDANAVDLGPGTIITIDGHPHDELGPKERLLVVELSIEGDSDDSLHTSGRAVFASSPYKPRLATPKPRVRGVQSAAVVGPPGDEIHTDEFGRVRVQFPWDREGSRDEFSSCWMHVSQAWGGLGYGFINMPRVGHEVLVDFLDGDPDQPLVVGRVFNATQPVPHILPGNKTISAWRSDSSTGSGGFNEIFFEDKKGDELVYMRAERDLRKLVKNDETITVGHDRDKLVRVHETDSTGANRTEITGANRTEITSANRITAVGANRAKLVKGKAGRLTDGTHMRLVDQDHDLVVRGDKRERVDAEVHQRVLGDRREQIDGKQSITVIEDRHEKIRGHAAFEAGKAVHLAAGEDAVIHGVRDATIKGAGGFLRIDKGGVTIVGTQVKINAGGSPGSAPAAAPDEPSEASEAEIAMPEVPEMPPLPPPPPNKEWIEIALVQDDDPKKPVPFARYRIELPDGSILDGRLDAAGRALVVGVEAGTCAITFPDLDADSWDE